MKKTLIILAIAFMASISVDVLAQSKDVVAIKGSNPKFTLPTTDVEAEKPDPKRSTCCLNFDNYTGYIIYVWVDDVYRGTVAAWDEDGLCVNGGWTTWYARTAGGTYSWSGSGECRSSVNLILN